MPDPYIYPIFKARMRPFRAAILLVFLLAVLAPLRAEELSVSQCFSLARQASFGLKSSELSLQDAGLGLQAAVAPFYPAVSFSGSEILAGDSISLRRIDAPVQWNTDTYAGGLTASLNLFSTFHDTLQTGRALKDREATRETLRGALQDLALKVTQQYYDLLRQRKQASLASQTLRQRQERLKQAEELYANGSRSYSDLLSARTLAKSAELDLFQRLNQGLQAETAFNALMGLPLDQPIQIADSAGDTLPAPGETASQAMALEKRDDLRRLVQARESLRASYELAWLSNLPYLSLDASASKDLARYGAQSQFWSHPGRADENSTWTVTASVNYTFFQGFGPSAQCGMAFDAWQRADLALRQAQRDAGVEVRQACLALKNSLQAMEISLALVEAAQESLKETQRLYDKGMASFLEVTDAEVEAERARNGQTDALYDTLLNEARWRRAVGEDVIEGN